MAVISQMARDLILMSCDTVMFWKFRHLSWQDPDQEELRLVTKPSALQEETLEGFEAPQDPPCLLTSPPCAGLQAVCLPWESAAHPVSSITQVLHRLQPLIPSLFSLLSKHHCKSSNKPKGGKIPPFMTTDEPLSFLCSLLVPVLIHPSLLSPQPLPLLFLLPLSKGKGGDSRTFYSQPSLPYSPWG